MLYLASRSDAFCARMTLLAISTLRGQWPKTWSRATVIPVRKSSKPADHASGWRPISIIAWLLRLTEKSVKRLLLNHVELDALANGFRLGLATDFVSAAIAAINLLPAQTKWAAIMFDFSSAFPSLPHALVIEELVALGAPGYLISWIVHYLHHRTIRIRTARGTSIQILLTCGQAQGGLLGPLLWTIAGAGALRKLRALCATRGPSLRAAIAAGYADDTSAAFAAAKPDPVIEAACAAVHAVCRWAAEVGIEVSSKTRIVTNFNWPKTRIVTCAGRNIAEDCWDANGPSNHASVLGLTISARKGSKMRFDAHLDDAISKFEAELALLTALKYCINLPTLRAMYSAFCLPQLARHLPALATNAKAISRLDSAHAAGLKRLFDLHDNTRNATAVLELGFPTIAEMQECRSATAAVVLQHRDDLDISRHAIAVGRHGCPANTIPAAPHRPTHTATTSRLATRRTASTPSRSWTSTSPRRTSTTRRPLAPPSTPRRSPRRRRPTRSSAPTAAAPNHVTAPVLAAPLFC
jgi:hypothetical protein